METPPPEKTTFPIDIFDSFSASTVPRSDGYSNEANRIRRRAVTSTDDPAWHRLHNDAEDDQDILLDRIGDRLSLLLREAHEAVLDYQPKTPTAKRVTRPKVRRRSVLIAPKPSRSRRRRLSSSSTFNIATGHASSFSSTASALSLNASISYSSTTVSRDTVHHVSRRLKRETDLGTRMHDPTVESYERLHQSIVMLDSLSRDLHVANDSWQPQLSLLLVLLPLFYIPTLILGIVPTIPNIMTGWLLLFSMLKIRPPDTQYHESPPGSFANNDLDQSMTVETSRYPIGRRHSF
ncbi:uncharacterized protein BYT42DRAFT_565921 [Radiomyces spectabilis]|uniref:uncharacterized protein n=1 Tax=Radiomyces spectabilis TaxID=64574 RepID=UPI002220351B|nr:uncharacterized protein BYT42DRAFT_565921 [Radiomyces spectabilis]KAI8381273.1 hypothetical protein BYT42DRAFT_565921 [Radiomyces spectabilis]